jgi:hypothetical protein
VIVIGVPVCCRVTRIAGLREARVTVIGIACTIEVQLMTRYALRRSSRVLTSEVTLCTADRHMRSRQRETAQIVIKRCAVPHLRRVADRALMAECRQAVIRIRCRRVVRDVTTYALIRSARVATRMTLRAACCDVRTGELEVRKRVIVGCDGPLRGNVTLLTVLREAAADMIGIVCILIVCLMTRDTLSRGSVIQATPMTLGASCLNVRTGEREVCHIVIELRVVPIHGRVTYLAIRTKARLCMIWDCRAAVVGFVTGDTHGLSPRENSTDMTLCTICCDVRSGKREVRQIMAKT